MEAVPATGDNYRQQSEFLQEAGMSKEQFTHIFELYYKRVFHYIRYRVQHHHTAEDICSQVFEAVITKYDSFSSGKSPFEVWLFSIARNAVTDYYRAHKRRTFYSLDSLLSLVWSKPSPEELAIRDSNYQELFKALGKLREKERHVIAMKFGARLKHAEIAELIGVSEASVGVIVYRSLRKLQKVLEAGGFQYE